MTSDIRESEQAWQDCLRLYDTLLRVSREAWRIDGLPRGWAFVGLSRLVESVYRAQNRDETNARGTRKADSLSRVSTFRDDCTSLSRSSGLAQHRHARQHPYPSHMFFQSVSLRNFGSFQSADFIFRPGVVNAIVGQNGSGKSQLIGAVISALVGRPALRIDKDGSGPSMVDVIVREGDTAEHINLSVSLSDGGDVEVRQHSEGKHADQSQGALKLRLLAAWSNPGASHLLLSEGAMEVQSPDLSAGDFEAAIPDNLKRSPEWLMLRESGIMSGARGSGGQIALGVLLRELARRTRSRESLPLIVDGYFERIAEEHVTLCAKVLEAIAETSQVILLANRQPAFGTENTIYLKSEVAKVRSLAYYNYLIEQQRPRFKPQLRPKWVRGEVFPLPESRSCELKEIKGSNPVSAIASLVDQYVVAFLNAGYPQEGTILWGIRDEDRKITGVALSDQECDELRRVVTDKGSRDVYVKTDAGKKRLSALEIQYELLKRLGIDVP